MVLIIYQKHKNKQYDLALVELCLKIGVGVEVGLMAAQPTFWEMPMSTYRI